MPSATYLEVVCALFVALFVVAHKLALAVRVVLLVHVTQVALHLLDVLLGLFVAELLLEREVVGVGVRRLGLCVLEHGVPHVLVDVERCVAVRAALETVEQLLLDGLLDLGGAQRLDFARRLAALRLFLDAHELGSV